MHVGRGVSRSSPEMGQRVRGFAGAKQCQSEFELRLRIAGIGVERLPQQGDGPIVVAGGGAHRRVTPQRPELEPFRLQRRRLGLEPLVDLQLASALVGLAEPQQRRRQDVARFLVRGIDGDGAACRGSRGFESPLPQADLRQASVRVGPGRRDHHRRRELRQRFGEPADAEVHLGQLVVRGRIVRHQRHPPRERVDGTGVVLLRSTQRAERLIDAVETQQRFERGRAAQFGHGRVVVALALVGEREQIPRAPRVGNRGQRVGQHGHRVAELFAGKEGACQVDAWTLVCRVQADRLAERGHPARGVVVGETRQAQQAVHLRRPWCRGHRRLEL